MCSSVEHENAGSGKDAGVAVREALSRIDAEIKDMESQILQKEHWMWKKTTRLHVVDEMDDEMVVCNKDEEMELGGRGTRAVLSAKPFFFQFKKSCRLEPRLELLGRSW